MFNELVESSLVGQITHKRWTVILSAMGQVILLAVLILIPWMHTQALPKALSGIYLLAPQPPALQSQSPLPARSTRGRRLFSGVLIAPTSIPPSVEVLREPELPLDAEPSFQTNSVFNAIPGLDKSNEILGSSRRNPPQPPEKAPPVRIRQGGDVEQALLLSQTKPAYPFLAIQTHTQGDVVLHAVISKDGNVAEVQVVSGHPLLVRAAMEAVRQWRYKPTLLNGEPVEVDTTITVSFRLGR